MELLAEFLKNIEPNLTTGGVLFAVSFSLFKLSHYFWLHENEIAKENFEKIKNILGEYKDIYIRPIIISHVKEWVSGAYTEAVSVLADQLTQLKVHTHQTQAQTVQYVLKDDIETICSPYSKAELVTQLKKNDKVEGFFSTKGGVGLLDKLDNMYLKARDYKRIYDLKISACQNLSYSLFGLTFLSFTSMLHLVISFHLALIYLYIYCAIFLIGATLVNFIKFASLRRKLRTLWEELKITGSIDVRN